MQVLDGFLVVYSILLSEEKQGKGVDFFFPHFDSWVQIESHN